MARLENKLRECNKIAESCSRKPGTRNNWRKPTTEAGSRNSRLMKCGFCKLLKVDSGAAKFCFISRGHESVGTLLLSKQPYSRRNKLAGSKPAEKNYELGKSWMFSSGRLALMAGAASWQGNKDVQEDRWPFGCSFKMLKFDVRFLQLLQ